MKALNNDFFKLISGRYEDAMVSALSIVEGLLSTAVQ